MAGCCLRGTEHSDNVKAGELVGKQRVSSSQETFLRSVNYGLEVLRWPLTSNL
jgi:hypothetical protein